MPYQIVRHHDRLLWVTMHGHLALDHAEAYYQELWRQLDGCPRPTDLLVDGRGIAGASHSARQRTEQVVHHPHLGHIAFVVAHHHLLLFAPLVKLVSGIGLFGHENEALDYLHTARGLPPVSALNLPVANTQRQPAPPPPAQPHYSHQRPPASGGFLHSLTTMMNGWSDNLNRVGREHDDG